MAKTIIKNATIRAYELQRENERLAAALAQAQADLTYIAMMGDIDIDTEEGNVNE